MHHTTSTDETHRPVVDWRLWVIALTLLVVALAAAVLLPASGPEPLAELWTATLGGAAVLCWDRRRRAVRAQRGEAA